MPARQVTFQNIESAIRETRDQQGFIQHLLIDSLGWELDERAKDIEDISFDWSASDLRAEGLDQKIADGTIRQLRPSTETPWGIFLVEFNHPDAFTTGRGMTGPLRRILRGLVPSKRKASHLTSFKREHLLFICTHGYEHYRFAYFKSPPKGSATAPLAAFGWGPGDPIRTLCEFNLPALEWPHPRPAADAWIAAWAQAFDVEKVTKRFYEDYAAVFENVELLIARHNKLTEDELRLFTQTLFNRLMFLRFIERKHWLEFEGRHDYLGALFAAPAHRGKSFYAGRLQPLFFKALAIEGEQQSDAIGRVPFLNGGLFESGELDAKVKEIPDSAFEPIIGEENGLFYRYNFTVEESTPLDIEVAVDPEMLGKVFEQLVIERRESGSYYTPRSVVSFMCRESLKTVLRERTEAPEKEIAALVDSHDVAKLKESHAREIAKIMDNLKVVDPACGSGAYLLGMLHEMVAIYRCLYSDKLLRDASTLRELKLRIITTNLYGVDIDPFATNIAMLRLWLSLAVESLKPEPLPNLDFRIETGDALLAPDPTEQDILRAPMQHIADALVNAKRDYALSHGAQKTERRAQVLAIEQKLRADLKEHYQASIVDWRIQFAEAFVHPQRGFDIALANPPYISAIEFRRSYADDYREELNALYESARGAYDIYVLFFERALQCLRQGGVLCFISPNKFLSAKYARDLRGVILGRATVDQLADLSCIPIFEEAAVYPLITMLRRGSGRPALVNVLQPKTRPLQEFDLSHYTAVKFPANLLRSLPENLWGFLLSDSIDLLRKLTDGSKSLAEVGEVCATTTAAEAEAYGAAIRSRPTKNAFKVINTGTIEPYFCTWGIREMTDSGMKHLTPFLPSSVVSQRRRTIYASPKIVFAKMAKACEAFLDGRGEYASLNTNCFFAPRDGLSLEYVCAFCNSKVFMFIYERFFGALRMSGGYFQFQAPQLRVIPLRFVSQAEQEPFRARVNELCHINADAAGSVGRSRAAALRAEIDELFYRIYDLTDDECRVIARTVIKSLSDYLNIRP